MKEARIIFPTDGPLNQHMQDALHALYTTFGGVTVFNGTGHWRTPNGQPLQENVRIADIAYDVTNANDAKLYDIAWAFREAGNQVEVYLRYGNGHVQLVTERSCMDNGEFDYHKFIQEVKGWEDLERETVSDVKLNDVHVELNTSDHLDMETYK